MGRHGRRRSAGAILVACLMLATLLPPACLADAPPGGVTTDDPGPTEDRAAAPPARSGPPWPEPGVGLPAHYADWTLVSSPLAYQTRGWWMFPLEGENGTLEVLAVEDGGRAYRYVREDDLLRQVDYSPLDVADWTWNAMVAREGGGRDVLLVETHDSQVHSYWADDLTHRSVLHRSSRLLGTGDMDGDGHEDVWLRTTSGMMMVLNVTSGHLVATASTVQTHGSNRYAVGDVDGDGLDELLTWEEDGVVHYDGPRMERYPLHEFPQEYHVTDLRLLPREGRPAVLVGITYYRTGVAWLDLETGNHSLMDIDVGEVQDVVFPKGPEAPDLPRIYLSRGNWVYHRRSLLVTETTAVDLGGSDYHGRLSLVGEPTNATSVLVLARDADLVLLNATDLAELASTSPGPYRATVMAGGGDPRAAGLAGDALVVYGGVHLLDMANGTVDTLVGGTHGREALWARGPGGNASLFVLSSYSGESYMTRFDVANGTLVQGRTVFINDDVPWMGLFRYPTGTESLLFVTQDALKAMDPVTMEVSTLAAGDFQRPVMGDVDGDGVLELLHVDDLGTLRCLNVTNRSWEWDMTVNASVETMMVGEVDGDPAPDIVISYSGGHLEVRDGPTRAVEVDTNGTLDNVTSMTAGDLDSDGFPELVLARGPMHDIIVAEVRDGGLEEEWHWWSRYDDRPQVGGVASTEDGPVLPLLGVHPLCVLSFTEAHRLGDIALNRVSVDRDDPTEGDVVTVSVDVGMEGGFPADVLVELYVDLPGDPDPTPVVSRTVHLEPGVRVTLDLPWTARLGDHSLHAVANGRVHNLVAERDYGNNALFVNATVLRPYAHVAWQLGWGEGSGLFGCTAAVDTDGDGDDELVMVDGGGHLVIQDLPLGADAGFARPSWRSPRLGVVPCALDVGDADGDGDPEAVVATIDGWVHIVDLGSRQVTVSTRLTLYGAYDVALVRDPLFGESRVAVLDTASLLHVLSTDDLSVEGVHPTSLGGTRMAVADLDGDKVDDLVVVGRYNSMAVHPAGGLGPRALIETELAAVTATAVGDLTGDGRPELVAVDGANVSLMAVGPEGNWTSRVLWKGEVPGPVTGLIVDDWDWDGRPELLVAGPRLLVFDRSPAGDMVPSLDLDPGDETNGLALGHFPGRSGLRAAMPLRDGTLFMADGMANSTEVLWTALGLRTISMAAGDVDADGVPQVLAGTATGGVLVVDGVSVERSAYAVEGRPWAMAVVDWDGDGEEELAVQEEDGDLVLLGRDGKVELTVATALPGRVEAMVALPADADGGPHLTFAEDDWTVHVVDLPTGEGWSERYPASVPVGLGTVTDENGTLLLLLRRTGGFATMDPRDGTVLEHYPVHANTTAVAGYPEEPLVVAADGTGGLHVILLSSGGTENETLLEEPAILLEARDLDGDGEVEVLAVTEGGSVHFLRGDTLAPLSDPTHPMGSDPTGMVAGDVDLDGAVEVVLGGWSEMVALRVGQGRPLPDLVARVTGLPEGPVQPGEDVGLMVEVRNRGLAPAGPFNTVVTLDGEEVLSVTTSLTALDRTAMGVTVRLEGWGQESELLVAVDAGGVVAEFDEGNNELAVILRTIEGTEYRPDVRVDLLTVTPSRVPQGTNATLEARVVNTGNAPFSGDVLVFAVDADGGRRQLASRDLSVLPGLAVEVDQTLVDLRPAEVTVLVEVQEDGGEVMASLEVPVEVVPRADLGLLDLAVNTTATPRVRAGLPVTLEVRATNGGGAPGSGLLVLETTVNGTPVVLATARFDLAPGEEVVVPITFVPAGPGSVVLVARVVPDGEDVSDDDHTVQTTLLVLPHPTSYANLDDVLAEMTEVGLHLTVVLATADVPDMGSLEVRAYALDPAHALAIAADPAGGLAPGSSDVYNATRGPLEPGSTVLFDTIISPFEPGPDGTVVLLLAYYVEGGERTLVGQRMVLVAREDGGGGDGGGGVDGASMAVYALACALVAAAVVWGLYVRRTRDTGS